MQSCRKPSTSRLGPRPARGSAFTLVELLVALAIIALLVGLLLPSLLRVRWESRSLQCANNLRQICLGLTQYAASYRGRLPPADGFDRWYDQALIGPFLPAPIQYLRVHANQGQVTSLGGGVYVCPEDDPNSIRSYAMNEWISSRPRPAVVNAVPLRGVAFDLATRGGDRLILATEAFSWTNEAPTAQWMAIDRIGGIGLTPGARFGAGGGIAPPLTASTIGRFAPQNTELPFYRHRRGNSQDAGAVHIGFADAHVARFDQAELADLETGRSLRVALWTPIDAELEP